MNSCINPALKVHRLKPFRTLEDGNILVRGGSLSSLSCDNTQLVASLSDQIGDTDKRKWGKGQYEADCGLSANTTPEETCLALCETEKNVFDEAMENKTMNNWGIKLKEGTVVSQKLTGINKV